MYRTQLSNYYNISVHNLVHYFNVLTVKYHHTTSILGFFLILTMTTQLLSGIMLAFSLIPEPMFIPLVRDEEDLDDLYTDDFFWMHERGVDLLFIFSYLHLLSNFYGNLLHVEHEFAWNSGVFTFIVLHVVTFLGLVLCCTHLSEITLNIACNIMYTFFIFTGNPYWWFFTNNTLNADTIMRLAYAHYVSGFYLFCLAVFHALDMHYDWNTNYNFTGLDGELTWCEEALINELGSFINAMGLVFWVSWVFYNNPEPLSYEIFMWGDVGAITDIRFYGVAPHWYFRPFMAWLTVCPYHLMGISGILGLVFLLYNQPTLTNRSFFAELNSNFKFVNLNPAIFNNTYNPNPQESEYSLYTQCMFFFLVLALAYTMTFLPAGSYYQRVYGNTAMLAAYLYIFIYLAFHRVRAIRINTENWEYWVGMGENLHPKRNWAVDPVGHYREAHTYTPSNKFIDSLETFKPRFELPEPSSLWF